MKKKTVLGLLLLCCFIGVSCWYFQASRNIIVDSNSTTRNWLRTTEDQTDESTPSPYTGTFDEGKRQENIAAEPRYALLKNQAWETQNLNVGENGNGKILLSAVKDIDQNRVFLFTYWSFPIQNVKEDFAKYAGEYLLFDYCYLQNLETIEADSEEANQITGGSEFYQFTFVTDTGDRGVLYCLSDHAKERAILMESIKDKPTSVSGWPLGIDDEGCVVLGF